ncbi:Gmad2 immunoglobulin-like domain-containing protein [Nocardioides massiliensis]|uniref:Bacterial spore germination immunoglobulin-like domain-containing protein n=1 Tax=Nocardioides massiliensis TaxID=1325935 RepID=A0ABT9NQT3_9ACTN|nr:Gmad2 immunoglobulin-like domain-containing protein [Nocardioides massiliensis]MDP9822420.1 hypothetical protein [Nocardioides massiliensis]
MTASPFRLRRTTALAAGALALSVALTACGEDDTTGTVSEPETSATPSETPDPEPTETPSPSEPAASPTTYADDTGRITVTSIPSDDVVSSPFEVSGEANVFEANVRWQLLRGEEVVEDGFTTAEFAMEMAPYSFTVEAEPGDYTLVVFEEDASDGEGNAPPRVEIPITVG